MPGTRTRKELFRSGTVQIQTCISHRLSEPSPRHSALPLIIQPDLWAIFPELNPNHRVKYEDCHSCNQVMPDLHIFRSDLDITLAAGSTQISEINIATRHNGDDNFHLRLAWQNAKACGLCSFLGCLSLPSNSTKIRICVYSHPSNLYNTINKCSHKLYSTYYNHLCPVTWLHGSRRVTQQQMPICEAHLSQNGQKTEPLRAAPQPHRDH